MSAALFSVRMDKSPANQKFSIFSNTHSICISEYGSTLYVGMVWKKNGHPYISIANGKLKSLVIYTNIHNLQYIEYFYN